MNFLNIHIPTTTRGPEFIGCEPVDRATWLCLLTYCAEHETGGTIKDCRTWGDRRWMQTCAVSLAEVNRSCPLWSWIGDDLSVFGYSKDLESQIAAKRAAAITTNRKRWGHRQRSESLPARTSESLSESQGNVMEGKVRKGTRSPQTHFQKPTLEELKLAFAKAGMPEGKAQEFLDFYESKGWKIGKAPMRSWQHAVGTWKARWEEKRQQASPAKPTHGIPLTSLL